MLPTLGQIVAGMLFETVGWFNVDIIPMTLLRIVGLIVLLLGTYIAVVLATQGKRSPAVRKTIKHPHAWSCVYGHLVLVSYVLCNQLSTDNSAA